MFSCPFSLVHDVPSLAILSGLEKHTVMAYQLHHKTIVLKKIAIFLEAVFIDLHV